MKEMGGIAPIPSLSCHATDSTLADLDLRSRVVYLDHGGDVAPADGTRALDSRLAGCAVAEAAVPARQERHAGRVLQADHAARLPRILPLLLLCRTDLRQRVLKCRAEPEKRGAPRRSIGPARHHDFVDHSRAPLRLGEALALPDHACDLLVIRVDAPRDLTA
eukprot:2410116-Rhodomonas_salina.1